jgi:lipoate-protein ligase A
MSFEVRLRDTMSSPDPVWRIIDTGVLPAYKNVAFDDVLLEEEEDHQFRTTLRFLRYSPSAVLVGSNQSMEREVRLDFCRDHGIEVSRRLTGGGAIYFDETQIGWEVFGNRKDPLFPYSTTALYRKISNCVVLGLNRIGVNAHFRPRNDIEVEGRKISGTGGTEAGGRFLFQGTLLVDFDIETMMKALRIPIEKLKRREIESAKERVTCLRDVLGYVPTYETLKETIIEGFREGLDIELREGSLSEREMARFNQRLPKFSSDAWNDRSPAIKPEKDVLNSSLKAEGGLLYAAVIVNPAATWIEDIIITGDFFSHPMGIIQDLNSVLREQDLDLDTVEAKIRQFYVDNDFTLLGVEEEDIITLVLDALKKASYQEFGFSLDEANKIYEINNGTSILNSGTEKLKVLVPYCAKDVECGQRYKKDCEICGDCDASSLYQFADEHDLSAETICSFEDLMGTLARTKAEGFTSFIGSCCEEFYCRHHREMGAHGLPGLLLDIDSETCYELDKAREAYQGIFESQTNLQVDLLEKILRKIVPEGS